MIVMVLGLCSGGGQCVNEYVAIFIRGEEEVERRKRIRKL